MKIEQLKPYNSKNIIFYYLICLCILSCSNKNSNDKDITIADSLNSPEIHPDTTINEIMRLEDNISTNKFYQNNDNFSYVEFVRESPIVLFLSSDNKEYLMAYQYEGNTKNTFSYFEIGYNDTLLDQYPKIKTNYERFYTESGLSLGISLKDLISIKGSNYIDVNNNKSVIMYRNIADSAFLDRYKMPAYNIEIELTDYNIVKNIKFGFEYP